jgi:hypothetical protein
MFENNVHFIELTESTALAYCFNNFESDVHRRDKMTDKARFPVGEHSNKTKYVITKKLPPGWADVRTRALIFER